MATMSSRDIEEMKQAFSKADHKGDKTVSLMDLTQVFQELDDWSIEDLNDLFAAAGGNAENKLRIPHFVDWIMQDGDDDAGDAPMPGIYEEEEEDEDDDQGGVIAMKAALPEPTLNVTQTLTHQEWMMLSSVLEMDHAEGQHSFENWMVKQQNEQCPKCQNKYMPDARFCRNCGQKRLAEAEIKIDLSAKVPLKAFMDEHGLMPSDAESMLHLEESLALARKKLANGERPEANAKDVALPTAVEQVVRAVAVTKTPAEKAWDLVSGRKVILSHAGHAALESFKDRQHELVAKVKEAEVNPPLLGAHAGRQGNREHCKQDVNAIIEQCKKTGTKFTDPEWNVLKNPEQVLYVDGAKPGFDCTVGKPSAWKRLTELFENPTLFKGGIRPADIVQGRVGTCFFLGALGAMVSADDDFVKSCFMEYDIELGIYGVRFCLDGEWHHTVIDDYMPLDQYGRLLYAKGHDRDEVWVPLLEKAFCKLHTCYEMCDGGLPGEAVATMCGGCKGKFPLTKKLRADPGTPATYFKALKNARERGWILSTTFTQTNTSVGSKVGKGKNGEDVLATGLVRGHVYSVLRVVEAGGNKLVCCRNPWGQGEWKGKWSDQNRFGEWTDEMKAATQYTGGNDGKFWMSIEDFVATSGGAYYSRTFGCKWKKISQYSNFQQSTMQATAQWTYKAASDDELSITKGGKIHVDKVAPGWWHGTFDGKSGFFPGNYVKLNDRPIARFDLDSTEQGDAKETMTAVVMLIQPLAHRKRAFFKRKEDGLNYKDTTYPKVMLLVVGPDGKVALKKEGKKREINGEITLHGGSGKWKVYAMCLDGTGSPFTVRAYIKDGTATLTECKDAQLSEVSSIIAA